MKNAKYRWYHLLCLACVILVSSYPIYMGVSVLVQMAGKGAVALSIYPKYIIPYTPIAVAVIAGVLLMPLIQKLPEKIDILASSVISTGVFFAVERFMETKILVQADRRTTLESWQMSLCYVPPQGYKTRTWEAVNVLLGGYSPLFKVHFYLISVVIIAALLNSFYGFGRMILTGDSGRKKVLVLQSVTSVVFLGMCIWACFTAFYRTGELTVSPLSAVLMAVFFALLGVTAGIYTASFLLGKKRPLSVILPPFLAMAVTLAMYIGEMMLLNGNLYRFGEGFMFEELGDIVLAPADLIVIAAAGLITFLICRSLNPKSK
ncbi:MAG: hypothetical protein J5777_05130 [Clostridiales bacterium]|nr:hypothetical protein [Clostridiales bacterium]